MKKKIPKKKKITQKNNRDILYAPWRSSYVRRAESTPDSPELCVFCEALKMGPCLESLILHNSKTCALFLNKFPYNNGHLMVIPHRHTADLQSLSLGEYNDLNQMLKVAHGALVETYKPQGFNIGMNLGRVAGAGIIDHLHYHVVPRWGGDSNFMPVLGGTKVISENLEQTYEKLIPLFR